jgi:hypothetical protein
MREWQIWALLLMPVAVAAALVGLSFVVVTHEENALQLRILGVVLLTAATILFGLSMYMLLRPEDDGE